MNKWFHTNMILKTKKLRSILPVWNSQHELSLCDTSHVSTLFLSLHLLHFDSVKHRTHISCHFPRLKSESAARPSLVCGQAWDSLAPPLVTRSCHSHWRYQRDSIQCPQNCPLAKGQGSSCRGWERFLCPLWRQIISPGSIDGWEVVGGGGAAYGMAVLFSRYLVNTLILHYACSVHKA